MKAMSRMTAMTVKIMWVWGGGDGNGWGGAMWGFVSPGLCLGR